MLIRKQPSLYPCYRLWTALVLLLCPLFALANDMPWSPTRPIRLIVPFPPGGAVDTITRVFASRLSERLGQSVVVDNRGGANGLIGTDITAKAPADGHTLLVVPAGHAIAPSVNKKLPYNTLKDFKAIGLIGHGAYVLVIPQSLPLQSVGELIQWAKARPGQLNYALTGYGNATHLAGELFNILAGVDLVGVSYKGGGPALADLIGGQITAFFSGVASGRAFIKANKIRALGVTTLRRSSGLPDVPTLSEAGVADYEVDGWYGLIAPGNTPDHVIDRLNRDLSLTVSTPAMKERLLNAGIEAEPSTPQAFQKLISHDIARWATLIQKAHIAPY